MMIEFFLGGSFNLEVKKNFSLLIMFSKSELPYNGY